MLLHGLGRCTVPIVMGDFNVDILVGSQGDPFAETPGRSEHHSDRRHILNSFMRSHKLKIIPCRRIEGSPGGPFANLAATSPITRFPSGLQTGLPSRLDFALSRRITDMRFSHCWECCVADHCLGRLECHKFRVSKPVRPPRSWHCVDEPAMRLTLDLALPDRFTDVHDLHRLCLSFQNQFRCPQSAASRRLSREPESIKLLRHRLLACRTGADRLICAQELLQARRHIQHTLKRIQEINGFHVGGSI